MDRNNLIDPTQFVTEIPDEFLPQGGPVTLSGTQTMLPVDSVPLPDDTVPDEGALTPAEQAELARVRTTGGEDAPPPEPPAPAPTRPPVPDVNYEAAMQRIALLEAHIQALAAQPRAPQAPPEPPRPAGAPPEEAMQRVASRFEQTFGRMEALEEETQAAERANLYAKALYESIQDMLPTAPIAGYIDSQAARVAEQRVQQAMQQVDQRQVQRSASQQVIDLAIEKAREAGYDVYRPDTPAHARSKESVQFWALGTALGRPGLTAEQEIALTLEYMPPKAEPPPVDPTVPAPPRPQPMPRAGGTPGTLPGSAPEYQPLSMNQMLHKLQQVRRVGGSAA